MKYILASVLLLGILAGCNNAVSKEPMTKDPEPAVTTQPVATVPPVSSAPVVSSLPAFKMLNTGNQAIDLSNFKGKKVFVNLWATWCPPCRAEIPSIERLAAKTDNNKAVFVMLSLDEDFSKAKSYAVRNNMKLPVYYPAENLPQLFMVDGIPVTYIFNENGEIIYQMTGTANYDTKEFVDMLNK